jgi:hypothetical protein
VTATGLLAPVAVVPPGLAVTRYAVTGEPPFEDGATKLTDAAPSPAVATTFVGAPGWVVAALGVTGLDGFEGEDLPAAFVAVTANV